MVNARCRDSWDHTASLLSLIYNVNRDPGRQRAISPAELNPYAPKRKEEKIMLKGKNIKILKDIFVKGGAR